MKRVKILTHNNGIVTIDIPANADIEVVQMVLEETYGEFIQLSVNDVPQSITNAKS